MSEIQIPYLGLKPFSEENAPFFFGRDEQKRAIARSLRVSRLTVLFGESGVGKSSILGAGVVSQLRRDAEQNRQDSGKPLFAVVYFRDWRGENPLQELWGEIRASFAAAMGIAPEDLKYQPTPVETLQVWTESLSGKEGRGKLFIILDQFEEYFQYHPDESGEGTFAEEFPRWVNRSDLRVNFLIALRQDGLAKLHRFQNRILNIFDNQIELKCLDRSAAKEAIIKPIREYNLRQIITDHFQTFQLTVLSAASGMGKSRVLRAIAEDLIKGSITFRNWRGNPVTDLIQQINADLKARFPDISVSEPGTSLTEILQMWAQRITEKGQDNQLFIILDQFEEFFQYQPPDMEEGSFVAEFSGVVTHSELPVHFLIAIRDDARDLLKHFQELIPNIFDHLLQIKQLGENPEIPDLVKPIEEKAQHLSKAIDIEPELVEEVLDQLSALSQYSLAGASESETIRPRDSQETVKIEAPLLQLVMERLWKEEVDQKESHCLRLETLNALSNSKKGSGAQRIANDHLSEQMQALSSDRERNAMAIVFKYLVSAEGTKIAYPLLNLPKDEDTKLDSIELKKLLTKFDDKRILRTVKVPSKSDKSYYEIFHDILALPILKWRDQYLLEQKLKEQEEKRKQKARKRFQIGSLIGLGMVVLFVVFGYDGYVSEQIKKIDKENDSIEESEKIFRAESRPRGQIQGLIQAMQAGGKLLKLSNNIWLWPKSKNINETKKESILILDEMLKEIREKNNFILPASETNSLSTDGKLLATVKKSTVSLWTLEGKSDSKKIIQVPNDETFVSLSFSSNGKFLATSSADGIVRLWTREGEQLGEDIRIDGNAAVLSLSFHPDGNLLAIGSDNNTVRLLDFHNLENSEHTGQG